MHPTQAILIAIPLYEVSLWLCHLGGCVGGNVPEVGRFLKRVKK